MQQAGPDPARLQQTISFPRRLNAGIPATRAAQKHGTLKDYQQHEQDLPWHTLILECP
jgi:hypothetical protein